MWVLEMLHSWYQLEVFATQLADCWEAGCLTSLKYSLWPSYWSASLYSVLLPQCWGHVGLTGHSWCLLGHLDYFQVWKKQKNLYHYSLKNIIKHRCNCWMHKSHFAGHARVKMFVPSLQFCLRTARYCGNGGSSSSWGRGGHIAISGDGSLHVWRSHGLLRNCSRSFLACPEDSEKKRELYRIIIWVPVIWSIYLD